MLGSPGMPGQIRPSLPGQAPNPRPGVPISIVPMRAQTMQPGMWWCRKKISLHQRILQGMLLIHIKFGLKIEITLFR